MPFHSATVLTAGIERVLHFSEVLGILHFFGGGRGLGDACLGYVGGEECFKKVVNDSVIGFGCMV